MSTQYPNGHDPLGDTPDHDHDPDPKWALEDMDLEDMDEEDDDLREGPHIPFWVIVIAVLIALAMLLQLGWPLVMDFLDRGQESQGFPTPGPV